MPVNFLNLPCLDVVDFREMATEYHVRAKPKAVSRQCHPRQAEPATEAGAEAADDAPA
jgi:hypothetical protein